MSGPVPKRSEHRRRRNKEGGEVETLNVKNPFVDMPAPDPEWHPLVHDWYVSLMESAQSRFYEPSDHQHARLLAHLLSTALREKEDEDRKLPAMLLQTIFSEMSKLLTTEGERRRMRLEIERGDSGADKDRAEVTSIMAKYTKEFS